MAVPTVQTLDQIMAELQPGYAAQRNVIGQSMANTNETYRADELALDAARTQGFNQINEQATGKGIGRAFSGIPIYEQAEYLSTKYLPGKQDAKARQRDALLTLEGQNAALDADIRNRAFGARENQQSYLNQWNMQQQQQQAAAEAARLEREFQAGQNAMNRAAQAASQPKGPSGSELKNWALEYAKGRKTDGSYGKQRWGSDKKISPAAYYAGFSDFYTETGLGAEDYTAVMAQYVNRDHLQDYRLN